MPSIGPTELIIVMTLVLLILGPKRLPEAGRSLGRGIREFRTSLTSKAGEDPADAVEVDVSPRS